MGSYFNVIQVNARADRSETDAPALNVRGSTHLFLSRHMAMLLRNIGLLEILCPVHFIECLGIRGQPLRVLIGVPPISVKLLSISW